MSFDESQQPSSGDDFAPEVTPEMESVQTDEEEKPKRDRSAEARIAKLTAKTKELERKLAEQERVPMPPVNSGNILSQQEIEAVDLLKGKLGFADKETVKKEIGALEGRLAMQAQHSRLEGTFDGSDGRPKYDRQEVEDYMRANDIFKPEAAYNEMYRQELLDWEIKKATSGKRVKPYSAPPSSPSKGEDGAITPEKIAEMQAKGKEVFVPWYTRNRDKIRAALTR